MKAAVLAALRALRLEATVRAVHDSLRRRLSSLPSLASRNQTTRAYRRLAKRGMRLEKIAGTASGSAIPVVMCMWRRPERIETILTMLDGQRGCPPIRLVLWNNDLSNSAYIRAVVRQFSMSGSLESVELYDSSTNVGGVGRFLTIRELRRQGTTGSAIMIDDDQDVSESFIRDLISVAAPRTISGVWAWRIHGGYWERTQVTRSGDSADYVGTGGCICDSTLVDERHFFKKLPSKFLFMEDIWMSRVAVDLGWSLHMVDTPVSFVLAERDQGHALHQQKTDFYDWLLSRS